MLTAVPQPMPVAFACFHRDTGAEPAFGAAEMGADPTDLVISGADMAINEPVAGMVLPAAMKRHVLLWLCALLLGLSGTGCVQIHLTVRLNEDGSGTVTERVELSRRLLEMEAADGPLHQFLGEEAARARAAEMGESVRLLELREEPGSDGGKAIVAVYHAPQLDELRLVSPYLATPEYRERYFRLHLHPVYSYWRDRSFSRNRPGWVGVRPGRFQWQSKLVEVPQASPAELQQLRDLLPVYRDMLRGFRLRMDLEFYDTLRAGGYGSWAGGDYRGSAHLGSTTFQLLDIHPHGQRDRSGRRLIDNDEVLIDMIRGDWNSDRIRHTVEEFWKHSGTPVFRPQGRWSSVFVLPSKQLWMRWFDGLPEAWIVDPAVPEQQRWLDLRADRPGEGDIDEAGGEPEAAGDAEQDE